MTPPFLLSLALQVAPPQMPPTATEAPSLAWAPAGTEALPLGSTSAIGLAQTEVLPFASAPAVALADIGTDAQRTSSVGTDAATPAGDTPPELADPLANPATAPKVETQSKATHYPGDPLEGFNRKMFAIHEGLDKALYGPASSGYEHVLPKPARSALRNFFRNLTEPVVFLNDLLQLKPGRAAHTLARFTINSIFGVGGLVDVATSKKVNLRHHNNGFGNTLAYYGVHSGPYLFLPLVGPTTLRDLLGGPVDAAVLPTVVGKPFNDWRFAVASAVITGLDLRAESAAELHTLLAGAVDPYATLRSVWLQNRAAEISALHSHRKAPPPAPELEDPMRDPATAPTSAVDPATPQLEEPLVSPAAATGRN